MCSCRGGKVTESSSRGCSGFLTQLVKIVVGLVVESSRKGCYALNARRVSLSGGGIKGREPGL